MKRPYIKVLGLMVVVLAIGLVFTSLKSSKKYKFKESAKQLHTELLASNHQIDPNTALDMINNNDDNHVFVDLRNPREYANFHVQGAINVPMQRVLDDEYIPYLKDNRIKILYSENSIDANQVRLLLTQYGYENLMVLQGGANFWKENMMTKDVFKSSGTYEDEKLNFDPEKLKGED
jgi:rhodanese-related sulfurtransferase